MLRILPFLFLFIFQNSYSQKNLDSLNWANASLQKEKLRNGLIHKTYRFSNKDCLGLNENINILEVKSKTKKLRFGLASADIYSNPNPFGGTLKRTSEIAQTVGAIAAVNAGFFDMKNGGAVDYIKIENRVYDTSRVSAKQRLPFKQAISALTINQNKVKIIKGEKEKGWEEQINAEFVLLTGPLLLLQNEAQSLAKTAFNENRHPRTCACLTNSKKLMLVTVDGRAAESEGLSLPELTKILKSLDCKDAINFDGGGSTTMYIAGKPENGVVNYPSDNKKFDHHGERSVSNIFYIK